MQPTSASPTIVLDLMGEAIYSCHELGWKSASETAETIHERADLGLRLWRAPAGARRDSGEGRPLSQVRRDAEVPRTLRAREARCGD